MFVEFRLENEEKPYEWGKHKWLVALKLNGQIFWKNERRIEIVVGITIILCRYITLAGILLSGSWYKKKTNVKRITKQYTIEKSY